MSGGSAAATLLLVAAFASTEQAKDATRLQQETARRTAQERAERQARPASPPQQPVRIVTIVRRHTGPSDGGGEQSIPGR
ncbi:hypothetical protein AB0I10_40510 [Streptomyces sp. NPDC050636]|uniref:hypothetical protein n=1 Tax=Streptomyces sp. NPDC050636 TaxID=3154510 RepID=UPI003445F2D4